MSVSLLCGLLDDRVAVTTPSERRFARLAFSLLNPVPGSACHFGGSRRALGGDTAYVASIRVELCHGGGERALVGSLDDARAITAAMPEDWSFSRFEQDPLREGRAVAEFTYLREDYPLEYLEELTFRLENLLPAVPVGQAPLELALLDLWGGVLETFSLAVQKERQPPGILAFYASPSSTYPGGRVQLLYQGCGVERPVIQPGGYDASKCPVTVTVDGPRH